MHGDLGDLAQGFDVVHHGRLVHVAAGDRERRPDARLAGFAFERLDQGRLFAADVGAGTEMDLDVEIEAADAGNVLAEQLLRPHAGQVGLELRPQVAVFGTQVEQTELGADRIGGNHHAFENAAGIRLEQDAVLEGAGLAFVGVADDVALFAAGLATGLPFDRGREAGAAAAAQVGGAHLGKHAVAATHDGGADGVPGFVRRTEQHVGTPDVVVDLEKLGRPLVDRYLLADQGADFIDALRRHAGNRDFVDQDGRPLVAHAGTRGQVDADQAVGRDLPGGKAEIVQHALEQNLVAKHAVGDVVGEQDAITAAVLGIEEGIEIARAAHLGIGNVQALGEQHEGVIGQVVEDILHIAQDLEQAIGSPLMALQNGFNETGQLGNVRHGCNSWAVRIA